MGVAGVALASIVSQYLSALLVILSLLRAKGIHELRLKRLRLHSDKAVRLLGLSIPAGCQNAIFHVANLFIQAGVNSFDTTVVAGNSAAANADGLVYDVMAAFYTACSSFMSQNYGAGKRERILKSYYISLAYSFTAGAALGLLLVIFGRPFLSLFAVEEAVIEAGMIRLSIMGLSYGVSAFMDATIAASRGIGKSLWPTAIVIMGSCVFRVIWVYTVFAHFHTMQSLYLLYVFSWSITAIAEILYFAHNYRKLMRYPLPDTNPTPKTLEETT
jgi:Na+-driven multidrug efflux pump